MIWVDLWEQLDDEVKDSILTNEAIWMYEYSLSEEKFFYAASLLREAIFKLVPYKIAEDQNTQDFYQKKFSHVIQSEMTAVEFPGSHKDVLNKMLPLLKEIKDWDGTDAKEGEELLERFEKFENPTCLRNMEIVLASNLYKWLQKWLQKQNKELKISTWPFNECEDLRSLYAITENPKDCEQHLTFKQYSKRMDDLIKSGRPLPSVTMEFDTKRSKWMYVVVAKIKGSLDTFLVYTTPSLSNAVSQIRLKSFNIVSQTHVVQPYDSCDQNKLLAKCGKEPEVRTFNNLKKKKSFRQLTCVGCRNKVNNGVWLNSFVPSCSSTVPMAPVHPQADSDLPPTPQGQVTSSFGDVSDRDVKRKYLGKRKRGSFMGSQRNNRNPPKQKKKISNLVVMEDVKVDRITRIDLPVNARSQYTVQNTGTGDRFDLKQPEIVMEDVKVDRITRIDLPVNARSQYSRKQNPPMFNGDALEEIKALQKSEDPEFDKEEIMLPLNFDLDIETPDLQSLHSYDYDELDIDLLLHPLPFIDSDEYPFVDALFARLGFPYYN